MTCPRCKTQKLVAAFDGTNHFLYCPKCAKEFTHYKEDSLPLEGTEKRPAATKRKKPTDAQKVVQKAASENQAEMFRAAWFLFGDKENELPIWSPEYAFHPDRNWRFDWAMPSRKIAVEVDGGQWMPGGGRHGTDGDREKLNEAAALGWLVFRFSPKQLRDDPEKCVRQVERALRLRGGMTE